MLDATVGQNGLVQAREFMAASGANGIVLTKLDGTAKGGVAVAIAHELKLPIRFIGVGEGIDDLLPFDADGLRRRAVHREVVTRRRRRRVHGAGAVLGRARARPHEPQSHRRRRGRVARRHRRRPGRAPARPAGRTPRSSRSRRPARGRRGATLYCTLEPCCHTGRTGPCVERIVAAGVAACVAAVARSQPARGRRGIRVSCARTASTVDVGVGADEAARGSTRRSSPGSRAGARS